MSSRAATVLWCAWVLWFGVQPRGAYESKAACDAIADKVVKAALTPDKDGVVHVEWLVGLQCLPDTIDPRGGRQ